MYRQLSKSYGARACPLNFRDAISLTIVLEALEPRRLLSGSVELGTDGILRITGTDHDDHILVYRNRADSFLIVDGLSFYLPPFSAAVPLDGIRGIEIRGLAGDDLIDVRNNPFDQSDHVNAASMEAAGMLNIPVTMYGGDGDDVMNSESNADDVYYGGRGHDHAYTMDGHDQFAVEYIENYRDGGWRTDAATGRQYWDWGGSFGWTGPEDQLYPDPWQVPTRQGTYFGSNAPVFPPDNAGGHGGGRHPSNVVVPVTPNVLDDNGGGGSGGDEAAAPITTVVPPMPSSSPFSLHPLNFGGENQKPWDYSIVS